MARGPSSSSAPAGVEIPCPASFHNAKDQCFVPFGSSARALQPGPSTTHRIDRVDVQFQEGSSK